MPIVRWNQGRPKRLKYVRIQTKPFNAVRQLPRMLLTSQHCSNKLLPAGQKGRRRSACRLARERRLE